MQQVKDLMSPRPTTVSPQANLHEALKTMNHTGYRHIPVVANDRLVGILTDRDIRLAVNSPILEEDTDLSREKVLDDISVGECMTSDPQCVTSDTPLNEVAELLMLNKFGAMPVVDDGQLVGLISTVDFLKPFAAGK